LESRQQSVGHWLICDQLTVPQVELPTEGRRNELRQQLVWPIVKNEISVLKPQILDELKEAMQTSWESIPQIAVDKVCKFFKTRLLICRLHGNRSRKSQGPLDDLRQGVR
jgi:hypothetical protein